MRFDLQWVASWIDPGTKVLDLGCGEGDLLQYLKTHKGVEGTGIELDQAKAARSIERGLSVLQGDMNDEIGDFPDQSFDYIVLSQTLQQVYEPDRLIRSILRIGRNGIVTFPNFSHWRIRLQLLLTGYAPVTRELPFQWYDTPNIRVITIKDFIKFSKEVGFQIIRSAAINTYEQNQKGELISFFPNLRAAYGIFQIRKR
ncbi:MAG: methionine biosynthesis protein MetW [Thermodesulfobacteriota bacterium]